MKSLRSVFAVTTLALSLVLTSACSSDGDGSDDPTEPTATQPSASVSADVPTSAPTVPYDKDKYKDDNKDLPKPDGLGTGKNQSTNDGPRPTVEELAGSLATKNSLVPQKINSGEAVCVAKIIVKSDLSDSAVRALYNKDIKFDPSKADLELLRKLNEVYTKRCID